MRIAVPRETAPGERRVALSPDAVSRLVKANHTVLVETNAGIASGFSDAAYASAGATGGDAAALFASADVIARVRQPAAEEIAQYREGATLVALLAPAGNGEVLERLAARGITAYAMELVPRTTKAQSMDALSSQATIAGYKAVLIGAAALPRILPMLTTAAGTLPPARAFVIGAGVAGLQAIATARRLGAVVSAFDVRPAVKEQVQSLGATFVEAAVAAEAAGGYARELGDEQRAQVERAIAEHIVRMDLVITTALVPGRPAPRIVTDAMLAGMGEGSVVVDLAAEAGGNCEGTVAGQTIRRHGVTLIGAVNLPATVPGHASQMYGRNLQAFIEHVATTGGASPNLEDPILGPMCVVHAGRVRFGG